jgi:hypothetical protein
MAAIPDRDGVAGNGRETPTGPVRCSCRWYYIGVATPQLQEQVNMTTKSKIQIVELSAATRDPVVCRRELCISRLQDQAKLLNDPDYVRIITRWSGKGAARKSTEKKLTVRPWWTRQLNGVSMRLSFCPGASGGRRRVDGGAARRHR